MRILLYPLLAVLGAGITVLPAVAGSETSPTVSAENYSTYYHRWTPANVTVAENGVVSFSNPTEVPHGIEWRSVPVTPVCSSGVPVGKGPADSGKKWSGTCTFTTPGVYTFYCTVHGAEMTGTVTVTATGTPTATVTMGMTETTPTTTMAMPTTTTTSSGSGSGIQTTPSNTGPTIPATPVSLFVGSASTAVKLASIQHGQSVHGSVDVSQASAGGRLEVQLLAAHASLASAGHSAQVHVGRVVRSSLHAGKVAFTVALDARARSTLHARGHLALSVKLVLHAPGGATATLTRSVVVRG